ncbi:MULTISPECIES: DUF2147 domain-containing protein [Sphingomonadales]|uniref:DUF2147 domain-containing protein n=2 Tax=Edaphosphingomonas TaxID=3423724 RepID=A0A2T4I650_9SPHN|nr:MULTISPECIES: DUF2147 domain-containing protein [Sphingomonas]AGH48421.1 hypothetical protein G432_03470 [Sphingomonas sp. MM-1]MDX3883399.1 DUF2147 domain-containing protein [Sphingomonas sp.]OHT20896.1 hypothetical protein BHE75_02900 [Sphingomonas haloaromaticamans]PTD26093.1 DUF2147 domain-containing protein [Sphingomonas fennica]
MKPCSLPIAAASLLALCWPAAASAEPYYGLWRNPKDSVRVRTHPCGARLCGTVEWANDKAKADAREGGTENLVGTELFRDFRPGKNDIWRGKVFVPDMNKTFSGTLTVTDGGGTLRARGCLFAGVGCKSQYWTRIDEAAPR